MIELYHNDMSVCAQKVRFALAEKEVAYVRSNQESGRFGKNARRALIRRSTAACCLPYKLVLFWGRSSRSKEAFKETASRSITGHETVRGKHER
jgi:hypothetical protein